MVYEHTLWWLNTCHHTSTHVSRRRRICGSLSPLPPVCGLFATQVPDHLLCTAAGRKLVLGYPLNHVKDKRVVLAKQ